MKHQTFIHARNVILSQATTSEDGKLYFHTDSLTNCNSKDLSVYGSLGFAKRTARGKHCVDNMLYIQATSEDDLDALFMSHYELTDSDFRNLEGIKQLIDDNYNIYDIRKTILAKNNRIKLKYLKLHPSLPALLMSVGVPADAINRFVNLEDKVKTLRDIKSQLIPPQKKNTTSEVPQTVAVTDKPTIGVGVKTALNPLKIQAAKVVQKNEMSIKKHLNDFMLLASEGISIENLDKEDLETLFS